MLVFLVEKSGLLETLRTSRDPQDETRAELAAVACGDTPTETGVASVEEAVALGRARLLD